MKFSYDRVWVDVQTLARTHRELLLVLGAAFLLLPLLLVLTVAGRPELEGLTETSDILAAYQAYASENWALLLLSAVVQQFGAMTLLVLMLGRGHATAGAVLQQALRLLPAAIVLLLLTSLALTAGLFVFIVGAIYVYGRLVVAMPVLAAEPAVGPLRAFGRSLALTKGRGWRIAGLFVLVFVLLTVLGAAIAGVLTVLIGLFASPDAAATAGAWIEAVMNFLSQLALLLFGAATYRELAGSTSGT